MSTGRSQEQQDLRWPYVQSDDEIWPQGGNAESDVVWPQQGDDGHPAQQAWDAGTSNHHESWKPDHGGLSGSDDDEDYEWFRYLSGGRPAQPKPSVAPASRSASPVRSRADSTRHRHGSVGNPRKTEPEPNKRAESGTQDSRQHLRREQKAREQQAREQKLREQELREQELREQELRDREREQQAREQETREQEQRSQQLAQQARVQEQRSQQREQQAREKEQREQQRGQPRRGTLQPSAAATEPVGRARSARRSRRRLSRLALWLVAGAIVIPVAVAVAVVVRGSGTGPAHVLLTPVRLGAYARNQALAGDTGAEALRTGIVRRSSGEAKNVVDAVYEDATGPAAAAGPQIILFIGGNLSGTSPNAFITSFTGQLTGAVTTSAGSLGGEAACVPSVEGRLAECAWADDDTFGVIASPTLGAAGLAKELRAMRPLVEHAAAR